MLAKDSSELTEFINTVREGIEKSQKQDFELLTSIDFEVSVIMKKEGGGGVNILIVDAGGKYEKESISKIKFSMGNTRSLDQIVKAVEIYHILSKTKNADIEAILKVIQPQNK